jgi:hypothetical protein
MEVPAMAILVADCPRCGVRQITFDVRDVVWIGMENSWKKRFEAFGLCRNCNRATIFILAYKWEAREVLDKSGIMKMTDSLNFYLDIQGYISLKDKATVQPPDHLPEEVGKIFREGATCLAVQCHNAAGTMFRLCIDLVTRGMLPEKDEEGLNHRTRRDLGLRLPWLFDHHKLPEDLRGLSICVREDGNDGAHQGTLTKEDAEDLLDFTHALLERIFAEPARLKLAEERRKERRKVKSS